MLAVFHEAGFPITTSREQGTVSVSMAIRRNEPRTLVRAGRTR